MENASRERVLISTRIDLPTGQLLRCRVSHSPHREIGCGQSTGISQGRAIPKSAKEYPALTGPVRLGQQNICRLDIAVQQASLRGMVKRISDRECLVERHSRRITLAD